MIFFNNKKIIIKKLCKKLNNKKFELFKILILIKSFYKIKLSKIIKIYNVFYIKYLNYVIINLLFN